MSKDAQLALAMPDRLVRLAGPDRTAADPAAGTPQALELRHLRYFVALADAGSFTRAAEKIFIAQPTLSQQIRRLEEIVGTPLLQRRREGLRLTPAGRVLLDGSRNVLALADQAVSRTRQAAGLGRPWLRVVMPPGLYGDAGSRPELRVHRPAIPALAGHDLGPGRGWEPARRRPDRPGNRRTQPGLADPAISPGRHLRHGPGQPPAPSADRVRSPGVERRPAPPPPRPPPHPPHPPRRPRPPPRGGQGLGHITAVVRPGS